MSDNNATDCRSTLITTRNRNRINNRNDISELSPDNLRRTGGILREHGLPGKRGIKCFVLFAAKDNALGETNVNALNLQAREAVFSVKAPKHQQ